MCCCENAGISFIGLKIGNWLLVIGNTCYIVRHFFSSEAVGKVEEMVSKAGDEQIHPRSGDTNYDDNDKTVI